MSLHVLPWLICLSGASPAPPALTLFHFDQGFDLRAVEKRNAVVRIEAAGAGQECNSPTARHIRCCITTIYD